jgi:hypothetical protein
MDHFLGITAKGFFDSRIVFHWFQLSGGIVTIFVVKNACESSYNFDESIEVRDGIWDPLG